MRHLTLTVATLALAAPAPASAQNALSPAEEASGWILLFDGASTDGWRGYRQQTFPEQGWSIEDGALHVHADGGGGDIITEEMYTDFELELEYMVAPSANSGIMYRVQEKHDTTWQTGPEYQILDDEGAGAGPTDPHGAGALYDLYGPAEGKVTRPAGEWNTVRILLKDGRLEHWLNGVKLVDTRTDTGEWLAKIAGSKFAAYEGFGVEPKGHIALQDHGNDVWFRSIKLRDQSGPRDGETALIGAGFDGWTAHHATPGTPDDNAPEPTPESGRWSITDGVLRAEGAPTGYLRTDDTFTDFTLRFQYRFPEGPGNSGLLFQLAPPDKVWPASLEVQMQHGRAGDFINIGNLPFTGAPGRTSGRRTAHTTDAERTPGEWNDCELILMKGDATVLINGVVVNEATGLDSRPGHLAWQSEGVPIELREIFVRQLP